VISAKIDIAVSSGVMAPRSRPAGALNAVERGRVDAFGDQFFAKCRHLAAAADEGVLASASCNSRASATLIRAMLACKR
jgi:hypothetical protein